MTATAVPRRPGAALLALACVVVALLSASLVRGEVLVGRDLLPYFYPRAELIGRELASLSVPRWNPYADHGTSWFGPRAVGVLYPGHLLFALLPLGRAMAAFVALHLLLAMEGTRRLVGLERPGAPAVAAALVYGAGGFMTSQYWALQYLTSAALLPWALLGGGLVARSRGAAGAALVALSTGGANLAIEPQGALAAGALALVLAATLARSGARTAAMAWVCAGLIAGACLAGPHLLPLLDEAPRTNRAVGNFQDARWGLAPLAHVADLVAPGLLGDRALQRGAYWGANLWGGDAPWCSLGVGALGLAAIATALTRPTTWTRGERFGGALVLVGLLLASSAVSNALHLRFSAKWLVLTALGLAWLTATGFHRWRVARPGRAVPICLTGLLIAATVTGATLQGLGGPAALGLEPGPVDAHAAADVAAWAALRATLMAAGALVLWRARRALGPRRFAALALGLLTLDLLGAHRPGLETTREPVFARPPLAGALLRRARPDGSPARFEGNSARVLEGRTVPAGAGLLPGEALDRALTRLMQANASYRFGVRSVFAFESIEERARAVLRQDERVQRLPLPARLAAMDSALLLMAVDDLAALLPREREGLPVVAMVTPDIALVENLACPDWAYCVTDAAPAASLPAAIDG
ncbi:MAG: hypothetical protein KIT58_10900, partial [Planctomycetota bacterium]|nr:hypothetical protein [Planctomycetota bacterium]